MAKIVRGPGRAVIDGVRPVTWSSGEMCEFASALVSAMASLGEDVGYHSVMGVTGAAFRLTVNPNAWEPGSYSIRSIVPDELAPVRRAFEAVGRRFEHREMRSESEDAAAIVASIDEGIPVLAFGVVGPSDCALVTGYDDGGATLLGWSTYQDIPDDHPYPPDSTGYFRRPDWHGNTRGYLLIGEAAPHPARRTACVDALKWAVRVVRQTCVCDMAAGLAAYEFWARELLNDEYFAVDPARLGGPYLGHLCNLMMIDDRGSAAPFLRQIAADEPDLAPELEQAASSYDETCRFRSVVRDIVHEDFSEAAMHRLADRHVRQAVAEGLHVMRDNDAAAVGRIEACLARIGG